MMPANTIFITGASGFIGAAVVEEVLRRGYGVRALVHKQAIDRPGVQSVRGDLFDDSALDSGMAGCVGVIHLVGIIRERRREGATFDRIHRQGTLSVLAAAGRSGVRRFMQMSALGVHPGSPSDYARTKAEAEACVRDSGLDFTILRPALVHGAGGEFTGMLADWTFARAMPYLFMPYFGGGFLGRRATRLQPIHVGDVARAFADCLENPRTIGQTIKLAGPDVMTWPELYGRVSRQLRGRGRLALGIPRWYALLLTRVVPAALLPFNRAQVIMAGEDNTTDIRPAVDLLGWSPQPFDSSFAAYADQLHR